MVNKLTIITNMETNNECYTAADDAKKLMRFIKDVIPKNAKIWLPFDTEISNIYLELKKSGYTNLILSSILTGKDFYKYEPLDFDLILSNPPFSKRSNLFKRLQELDKPFILLQATQAFNNQTFINFILQNNNQISFLFPNGRMKFLRFDAKENKVRENENQTSFYSFWIGYKIGFEKTFNKLA